jgi:HEPN domain-containing protein
MTPLSVEKSRELEQHWAAGSQEDFATAVAICDGAKRYAACLFFLHLSVEKALKSAYVRAHASHAPYTHNLLVLTQRLGWTPDELKLQLLAEVNEFHMEARYPDEKNAFAARVNEAMARRYLNACQELLEWIKTTSDQAS